MQIVDLFCGIGGVAEATREEVPSTESDDAATESDDAATESDATATELDEVGFRIGSRPSRCANVVAAIDIDRRVESIYSANHGVCPIACAIESMRDVPAADVWWLSPPCQPYTRRGRGLAEQDPRSLGLARIMELLPSGRPRGVMLENVPAFLGSRHHRLLESILRDLGYSVRSDILCPTQWGIPMKRKRFYLRAQIGQDAMASVPIKQVRMGERAVILKDFIEPSAWDDESLRVTESERQRYSKARNQVDADDEQAIAACFTSAYGKSPVRSGSYLYSRERDLLRRFSPSEVARLMGYREEFWWPDEATARIRYQLLGNALCVPVVRSLLQSMAND